MKKIFVIISSILVIGLLFNLIDLCIITAIIILNIYYTFKKKLLINERMIISGFLQLLTLILIFYSFFISNNYLLLGFGLGYSAYTSHLLRTEFLNLKENMEKIKKFYELKTQT